MAQRTHTTTRAAEIRQAGVRVTAGPLSLFLQRKPDRDAELIVALGRTAGIAVVRARVRRIARDVHSHTSGLSGVSILLLARGDLSAQPRSIIRKSLSALFVRGVQRLG